MSARDRATVLDAVDDQLRHQPDMPTRHRKRMHRTRWRTWELRVGDYRIFYDVEPAVDEAGEPEVVILAIGVKTGNRVLIGDEEHEL